VLSESPALILGTALSPSGAGVASHHDRPRSLQGITELLCGRLPPRLEEECTVLDLGGSHLSVMLADVSAVTYSDSPKREVLEYNRSTTVF